MGLKIMANVEIRVENSDLEKAIRRFRREVRKSNVLLEYRDKMRYTKPSEKRRRKILRAQRRKEREEKE